MIAALAAAEVPAIRVILCPVGEKPCVTMLTADPGGGHTKALEELLGAPVARVPLHDGVELCCDRDGLLFGLALARRALTSPLATPLRYDVAPCCSASEALGPDEWLVSADFALARAAAGGELVDLTEADVRHWMFWLGLAYVLNDWWA